MQNSILSCTYLGVNLFPLLMSTTVLKRGFPCFKIVGVATSSMSEHVTRIRTGLNSGSVSGLNKKIIVQFHWDDSINYRSCYDLSVAAGVISLCMELPLPPNAMFFGEVGVDGRVSLAKDLIPHMLLAEQEKMTHLLVPSAALSLQKYLNKCRLVGVDSIEDLIGTLKGGLRHNTANHSSTSLNLTLPPKPLSFLEDVSFQYQIKRMLSVSLVGKHSVYLIGSPGLGKTTLVRAMYNSIIPLQDKEFLNTNFAQSVLTSNINLFKNTTPFVEVPQGASSLDIFGSKNMPGYLALAHNGFVLFDDVHLMKKDLLERLRHPLSDRYILCSNKRLSEKWHCNSGFVFTSNPCHCGYNGHTKRQCECLPLSVRSFQQRISGAFKDRIDLRLFFRGMDFVSQNYRKDVRTAKVLEDIITQVLNARRFRLARLNSTQNNLQNNDIKDKETQHYYDKAVSALGISFRDAESALSVARTVADLEKSMYVKERHLAEALSYKMPLAV